tara:strand:- start:2521 stop:2811 length:291 start_codon:yes stop_codon:yes gene_type:complete
MKKYFLLIAFSLVLNGCGQYTSMIGPSYTLVETGNVLQASSSYGSSYGLSIARQSISNDLKSERICQTVHSSELTEIFFETLDQEDCILDPMSIYR